MATRRAGGQAAARRWAPPSPEDEAGVRQERLDRVHELVRWVAPVLAPCTAIVAWGMWDRVPRSNLATFLWAAAVSLASISVVGALHVRRRRTGGPTERLERLLGPLLALTGLV